MISVIFKFVFSCEAKINLLILLWPFSERKDSKLYTGCFGKAVDKIKVVRPVISDVVGKL
jgi:hypothetical protein